MSSGKPGTIVFDLDGTLCTNTFGEYGDAEPNRWAIERVNRLAEAGHRIIVFTARGTATGIDWEETTRAQLAEWGLRYDELHFGKPSADVYVDDRAIHTDSWQRGDAFSPPGFPLSAGEGLPPAPPPDATAVAETGRTFAGTPLKLDEHALRAAALAKAAGLVPPAPSAIAESVRSRLAEAESGAANDVVYTVVLVAPPALRLDLVAAVTDPAPPADIIVRCRPLSEFAAGGSIEVAGSLGFVAAGRLTLTPAAGPADVCSGWIAELAAEQGIEAEVAEISAADTTGAEEALLVGMPQMILPLAAVGGRELPAGAPGPVTGRLLAALRESTGVDTIGQLRELQS